MKKENTKFMRTNYQYYMNPWRPLPTDIYEAYERPSVYKVRAWEYCKQLMNEYNGYGLAVTGHNCMAFSAGFIGYVDGLKCYFHITKSYDRYIPLEVMDKETGEVTPASFC